MESVCDANVWEAYQYNAPPPPRVTMEAEKFQSNTATSSSVIGSKDSRYNVSSTFETDTHSVHNSSNRWISYYGRTRSHSVTFHSTFSPNCMQCLPLVFQIWWIWVVHKSHNCMKLWRSISIYAWRVADSRLKKLFPFLRRKNPVFWMFCEYIQCVTWNRNRKHTSNLTRVMCN